MRKCSSCGKEWDDHIPFCGACGNATVEVEVAPVQKKQPKKWLITLIAVVSTLAVLAGIGALTNWFGLVSPLHGLGKAFAKTLSADSMTVEYSFKRINPNGSDWREEGTIQLMLNKDKEKLTYMFEDEDSVQLYDGGDSYYYREAYEDEDHDYAYYYESNGNDKSFFDTYEDIYDGKKVNWSEVAEATGLDEYIKKNKAEDLVQLLYKDCLKSKKWLKNNLGYSKKGNTYTFEPDIGELGESIIDVCKDSNAFRREAEEGLEEGIDYLVDEASDYDVDVTVTITVKKGYVSEIHIEGENEDGYGIELDIEITNVNKTKVPVSKIKNKVEDLLDEYGCTVCGESMGEYEDDGEYLCWDCYYICEECGEYGYERENGRRICYECYYVCSYCGEYGSYRRDGKIYCWDHSELCDECGERCDSTYTVGSEDLCYDCYYDCAGCGSSASYTYNGKRYCWDCYYDRAY